MANWLYSKIGDITTPPDLNLAPATLDLLPVAAAYRANIARIHAFWLLSPQLIHKSTVLLLNAHEALFKVLGHFPATEKEKRDPEIRKRVRDMLVKGLAAKAQLAKEGKVSGLEKNIPAALAQFDKYIAEDSGDLGLDDAIHATLSSLLTHGWTAFETLAADLWETALNTHPAGLANLGGSPKRIQRKAGKRPDDNELDDSARKQIDPRLRNFEKLTQGTFDAGKVMGTILRDDFRFDKLRGIREAYGAAFSKRHEAIDELLSSKSLDRLSLVRNVILHKAGKVDQQFIDGANAISWDCKVEKDALLPLNGEVVRDLVNPVFAIGWKLVIAVDEWISPPTKEPTEDASAAS